MLIQRDTSTLWAWAGALAVVSGLFYIIVQPMVERWGLRQKWWPRALELQRHVSIAMGTPNPDDEHCLRAWAGGILALMFHGTCGSLMLPVVIYGWEASETHQDLFLLGSLLDLGWDLYSQIQVYVATFHGDVADRWGWARCPRGIFPFIVMHHMLAYIIVVPMDNKYVHLEDYHQVCLSLLGAAACAMACNAVKMTLDVTRRGELVIFKALLTIESGIMLYTRGFHWFRSCYRILCEFRANGDNAFIYVGCVAATFMSLFNLMILPHIVGACLKWLPRKASDPVDTAALARTSSIGRRDSLAHSAKAAADVGRRMSTHVSRRMSSRFSSIKEE